MAKRRPVRDAAVPTAPGPYRHGGGAGVTGQRSFTPASLLGLAAAMIAAALVYAGYWPNDSIEVQLGGARYLVGLLLVAAALAICARLPLAAGDWLIDALAWALALWMIVATWANADGANLRLAVNELWWWIAAAALLSATRRCVHSPGTARGLLYLIAAITVGVAVFAWHQLLVAFPVMIARYEADPEAVLRDAGIVAEEGSAQRMIFENRLYDGGPTGTFALANSMAALLVGGSVVMIGLVAQQWRQLSGPRRLVWTAAIGLTLGMVVASRSRSAVASILVITVIYVSWRWLARQRTGSVMTRPPRGLLIGGLIAVLASAGIGIALSWRTLSQSEWVGQAPASLAIRINYWRACASMLAESPLVGVGPGQFKARYEAFRAPASTEQIADPHNWVWQALTTGGLPAGLLLVGLVTAILWKSVRSPEGEPQGEAREMKEANEEASSGGMFAFPTHRVYAGGGAAALAIWIVGAGLGLMPTLDAGLIASIAAVVVLIAAIGRAPEDAAANAPVLSRLALWAWAAMAIDLLVAGGLTVPGVAVTWWILAAIAAPCPIEAGPTSANSPGDQGRIAMQRWGIGAIAAGLLLGWYSTAILPVEQAAGPMARFQLLWSQRRYGEAEAVLRQAVVADRWDPEPSLQLAQVLLQQTLYSPQERHRLETRLHEIETETLRRAGDDPAIIRVLADGRVWHYQRYGDPAMLRAAADLYRRTVELSPSHQTYVAQLAEVYRRLDDPQASELARTAHWLSQAGGYYERTLPFIILFVAEEFGEAALASPVRRPAAEVLAPLLESPN